MSYLGIDLGTSSLRALLMDEAGSPIGSAEQAYEVSNPASARSNDDLHANSAPTQIGHSTNIDGNRAFADVRFGAAAPQRLIT